MASRTDDPSPTEERIEALEVRVAYQDQTIDELSATVADLWKQLRAQQRKIDLLEERLKAVQESGGPAEPEPPPPHY
jgi:SlyX protein